MKRRASQRAEADTARRLFEWREGRSPSGLFVTEENGVPQVWCHPGQWQAKEAKDRFVLVLSGAQSGKTALGPWWLVEEMQTRGPGNYILVAPTFTLLQKQAIPTLNRALAHFLKLGTTVGNEFRVSEEGHKRLWPDKPYEPTRIIFGYAENPDSLESLTAKAAWLDECGQRAFKQASWEAIQSRLAIHQGRVLFTSTPYEHNWLKFDVYEPAERNRKADRDGLPRNPADAGFDSVSYESRMNPAFPQAEWDRQKLVLPPWRFNMRYRGMYEKPAGAIYGNYVDDYPVQTKDGDGWTTLGHLLPGADFILPDDLPLYVGIDFGAPNFAAVFLYEQVIDGKKTGQLVVWNEYNPKESKTAAEHVAAMKAITRGRIPDLCVGGSKSEGQWRKEFSANGWPIREPDQKEVEVGIERVYSAFAEMALYLMDTVEGLRAGIRLYSRELDDQGEPISDTIVDKETWHLNDALRYIVSYLRRKSSGVGVWVFG